MAAFVTNAQRVPRRKPESRPGPTRRDPSRTLGLREKWRKDFEDRFDALRKAVWRFIVEEDQLGLKQVKPGAIAVSLTFNAGRYAFATDDKKVAAFQSWFKEQVDKGLLEVEAGYEKEPWTSPYVKSAYRTGVVRGFTDARPQLGAKADFYKGTQAEFLREAFASPEQTAKLRLLSTRAFDQLKGVTAEMDKRISMTLAEALSKGYGAEATAKLLNENVVELGRTRARMIARTEVIHAHAEGQLDSFERLGVEDVGIEAEWVTGAKACPTCLDKAKGGPYTIKQARGLIPFHPNCRCTWRPKVAAFSAADEPAPKVRRRKADTPRRKPGEKPKPKPSADSPFTSDVFYHGSDKEFEKFDVAKFKLTGADAGGTSFYGDGAYLSGEKWKATSYAYANDKQGFVYSVQAKGVRKPFVVKGTGAGDLTDALKEVGLDPTLKGQALGEKIQAAGFDSVVVLKNNTDVVNELVVFDDSKLKILKKEARDNVKPADPVRLKKTAISQTPQKVPKAPKPPRKPKPKKADEPILKPKDDLLDTTALDDVKKPIKGEVPAPVKEALLKGDTTAVDERTRRIKELQEQRSGLSSGPKAADLGKPGTKVAKEYAQVSEEIARLTAERTALEEFLRPPKLALRVSRVVNRYGAEVGKRPVLGLETVQEAFDVNEKEFLRVVGRETWGLIREVERPYLDNLRLYRKVLVEALEREKRVAEWTAARRTFDTPDLKTWDDAGDYARNELGQDFELQGKNVITKSVWKNGRWNIEVLEDPGLAAETAEEAREFAEKAAKVGRAFVARSNHMRRRSARVARFMKAGGIAPTRLWNRRHMIDELGNGERSTNAGGYYYHADQSVNNSLQVELDKGIVIGSKGYFKGYSHNVAFDTTGIYTHEYGHRVWYNALTGEERATFTRIWEDGHAGHSYHDRLHDGKRVVVNNLPEGHRNRGVDFGEPKVSEYATTNADELWAESYLAFMHPDYRPGMLPREIESFLENVLETEEIL
jgi:hypothetical protein